MAISFNANCLVTEANVKAYIGITGTDFDTILKILVDGVCDLFNQVTGRKLASREYSEELFDGNGEKELILPQFPVSAIAVVDEDDLTLTEGKDEDYLLYTNDNEAYLWHYGRWTKGHKNYTITYTAGFVISGESKNLPADLELAALKQIAKEFQEQKGKWWGEESRGLPDGGSVSFTTENLLPEVREVLRRYEKVIV